MMFLGGICLENQTIQGSFVKGAAILGIAGIIVKVLGAIFKIPLVSIIASTGMGYYSSAYPIYVMLLAIATSGFPIAISKMVAERRAKGNVKGANEIFSVILPLMVGIGIITSLGLFLSSNFLARNMLENPKAVYSLKALSLALLFVPIMSAYRGFFQGRNTMLPSAISQLLEQLGRVILGLTLALIMVNKGVEFGAAGASFGATGGAFFGLLAMMWFYLREKKTLNEECQICDHYEKENAFPVIKELLIIAIPVIIGALVKPIMDFIDASMVIGLLMRSGVGELEANSMLGQLSGMATTMVNLPSIMISAIAMSIVPIISYEYSRNNIVSAKRNVLLSIRMALLIGLPTGIGLMSLSEPIMSLLFPREPSQLAGQILFIAALGVVFLSLIQVLTAILQGVGKAHVPVLNLMIGVVFKVIITYLLTTNEQFGVKGAAIGTVVAYVISAFLDFIAVKKLLMVEFDYKKIFVCPVAVTVVMGCVARISYKVASIALTTIMSDSAANKFATLIGIIFAGTFYIVALIKCKIVEEDDFKNISKGKRMISLLKKLKRLIV